MDPANFQHIEDNISRFRTSKLLLTDCGLKKFDDQMKLAVAILSKHGDPYFSFVSTFYFMKGAFGAAYKIPTFKLFYD